MGFLAHYMTLINYKEAQSRMNDAQSNAQSGSMLIIGEGIDLKKGSKCVFQ